MIFSISSCQFFFERGIHFRAFLLFFSSFEIVLFYFFVQVGAFDAQGIGCACDIAFVSLQCLGNVVAAQRPPAPDEVFFPRRDPGKSRVVLECSYHLKWVDLRGRWCLLKPLLRGVQPDFSVRGCCRASRIARVDPALLPIVLWVKIHFLRHRR